MVRLVLEQIGYGCIGGLVAGLAAATLVVSSPDKIVAVQGIAGAGKSTMLQAVARVAESEGKSVLGLAFQNKMVDDMKEGMAARGVAAGNSVAAAPRDGWARCRMPVRNTGTTVADVYRIKRNVIERLRRSERLRQLAA